MAGAAIPIMVAGSVLSGLSQIRAGQAAQAEGQAQQQELEYRAGLARTQAGQERAASQRQAEIERRQAGFALSRARAVAAASGAGATDPTVATIEGRVAGEGEFNALNALYQGEERARGLENQSALDVYQGRQAALAGRIRKRASYVNAFGTILGSPATKTLYDKYGDTSSNSSVSPSLLPNSIYDPGARTIDQLRSGF